MGLDIYSGTLTRYYSRNWKTSVQQWGEKYGMEVNIIRPPEQNVEIAPAEEILEGVTNWRDGLIAALSENLSGKPLWNEDIDTTPYYTDKPDWDALEALMLYTACKALSEPVPETVVKNFDVYKQPIYSSFMEKKANPISLFDSDGWWLPINDSFMFKGYLPTGDERRIATVGMLKRELEQINSWEWQADEETIVNWSSTEGYPTDALYGKGKIERIAEHLEYNTVSLAKFAFSILWQAVKHSEQYRTMIIYDY